MNKYILSKKMFGYRLSFFSLILPIKEGTANHILKEEETSQKI